MPRLWICLLGLLVGPTADAQAGSPPFPGAKRVADASGRWYVAVEQRSDRWAFVERAPGAHPLPEFHDAGYGRHGLPGPDPVVAGDRVLARGRLGAYPADVLVAPDGSGFAAVATDYDADRRIRDFVYWVPVSGPRVWLAALERTPTRGTGPLYGPTWKLAQLSGDLRRLALRGLDGTVLVIRLADGERERYPEEPGAALVVEYDRAELPRLESALRDLDGESKEHLERLLTDPIAAGYVHVAAALLLHGTDGAPAARPVLVRAVHGDDALQLTPREHAQIVVRAFELLGADAGPLLLPLLAETEANVRRAVYWILGVHADVSVPLARAALADPAHPSAVRGACAWFLSRHLAPDETAPLLAATRDVDARVAATAVAALADRRWDAGREMLTLLEESGPHDEQVAAYFEAHVIPGAAPYLVAALRRTAPGSPLRERYVDALVTQTTLRDIGDDADAWTRALEAVAPR